MVTLVCPVRACESPLVWGDRAVACCCGHHFDLARSGYCNLLQPQDRKSKQPGDAREVVLARRRSLERGVGDALRDALVERIAALGLPSGAAVLDAGCGEGFYLSAVRARFGCQCWGVDLSAPAIELAARRDRSVRWIVANADRRLPFADGSFDLVMTITGPKHATEFRRLLAPGGHLLAVVAAEDDLAELRQAVLGVALVQDRAARAVEIFSAEFRLVDERAVRKAARLDAEGLRDLLAGTYRGARHRERERLAGLRELDVTSSYRILTFEGKVAS